jgi:hypothetical protein
MLICEDTMKHVNTMCEGDMQKERGTYNYHCAVKSYNAAVTINFHIGFLWVMI